MMPKRWVDRITAAIVAEYAPDRIVLFGSAPRALREGRMPGDLDFLVVGPSALWRDARSEFLKDLLPILPIRVDLVFVTPDEADAALNDTASLVSTALAHGETTYLKS